MIKHIIFDCDGVIVDSEILASTLVVRMLGPKGYTASVETHTRRYSGLKEVEILDLIEKDYGFQAPEDFLENFGVELRKAFLTELQAIPGMVGLISSLDLPASVVSNSDQEDVIRNTRKVGVLDVFEGRVFSADMVENPKPASDLYLKAIEEIGLSPDEMLVIEDSLPGVTAAKAAGLFTIGFLGASHIFEGHGEKLIEAGADRLAANAEELRTLLSTYSKEDRE